MQVLVKEFLVNDFEGNRIGSLSLTKTVGWFGESVREPTSEDARAIWEEYPKRHRRSRRGSIRTEEDLEAAPPLPQVLEAAPPLVQEVEAAPSLAPEYRRLSSSRRYSANLGAPCISRREVKRRKPPPSPLPVASRQPPRRRGSVNITFQPRRSG
eukprot:GHVU01188670.1.p2 GENE.GHVU01188670.1~~GHVU01188670.1.p2  ORF type:complete len:155 (-),score=14.20 GHVU01188670.1:244-708(-)